MASLEQLEEKRDALLKKAGIKKAGLEKIRADESEKRKIKAEIYALEHPGSFRAKSILSKAARGFGKSISRNVKLVAKNAERLEKARKERVREERTKEREIQILKLKAAAKRRSSAKKRTKKKTTRKRRKR